MNECIKKSLYYIETHLDEPFDLDDLAKIAGYSKYHFSRIFKLHVGESLTDYITRLRLEKVQVKVVQKSSIIDLALGVGYETPNGFNKAFKKSFGISPTEYKKIKRDFLQQYRGKLMEAPKIVILEEKEVVFTRETGNYNTSSKIAWNKLSKDLNKLGQKIQMREGENKAELIRFEINDAELFGICHDDPSVTQPQNIRYDACISWNKEKIDFLNQYGYETKGIEGGEYAMTTYYGSSDENLDSWYGLYGWCEENGYKFRDSPPFEKYVNMIENIDNPDKHITEIYIPIKT